MSETLLKLLLTRGEVLVDVDTISVSYYDRNHGLIKETNKDGSAAMQTKKDVSSP